MWKAWNYPCANFARNNMNPNNAFDQDENDDEIFKAPAANVGRVPASLASGAALGVDAFVEGTTLLQVSPAEAKKVTIHTANMRVTVRALKVTRSEAAIGLVINSEQCDLLPEPSEQYLLAFDDQELQTMYVGGRVEFDSFTLLSFITSPPS